MKRRKFLAQLCKGAAVAAVAPVAIAQIDPAVEWGRKMAKEIWISSATKSLDGEIVTGFCKPEIMEAIFPVYNDDRTILDFMIQAGRKNPRDQTTFQWNEF
jgi:hypothetical protein